MGTKVYSYSLVAVVLSTIVLLSANFSGWFIMAHGERYGLYNICLPSTDQCSPFCSKHGSYCSSWRTAVFFLNVAIALEVLAMIAYLALIHVLRTHHYRSHAKGAVTALVSSACITIVMGIGIAYSTFDKMTALPWTTGPGPWLAALSAVCLGLTALATLVWGNVAYEDGYEELD